MNDIKENGWNEMKNLVLSEIKRINKNYESLDVKLDAIDKKVDIMSSKLECLPNHETRINTLETNQSALNVKSGIWGVIGGGIPIIIMIFIYFIIKVV